MSFQIQYDYYPTVCTDVQYSYDDVERATKITANFVGRVNQPNLMYFDRPSPSASGSSAASAAIEAVAYQATALTVLAKAGEATLTVDHRSLTSELPLRTQFRLKVAPKTTKIPVLAAPTSGLDALLMGASSCATSPVLDLNAVIPISAPMHQEGRTIVFDAPILVAALPGMEGVDEYECSFGDHKVTFEDGKDVGSVVGQFMMIISLFVGLFLVPAIYNGFKLLCGIDFDDLYNYNHKGNQAWIFQNRFMKLFKLEGDEQHTERLARLWPSSIYAWTMLLLSNTFLGLLFGLLPQTPTAGISYTSFLYAGIIGLQVHKYMEELRLNKLPTNPPN